MMKLSVFRRLLPWLTIVGVAGVVFYRLKLAPIEVAAHTTVKGTITAEVMGTGTLEARVKATLSPRIQGRLAQVLVDQNDSVHSGQLLAQLDDGELREQVEISRAAMDAARAGVERVRADLARAEAVEKSGRLDHRRVTGLLETKVSSQADFDKAMEALHIAEADLRRAHLAITEAERQVITTEKTLLYQQERLADTRLVSPLDGLVVKRDHDPGDVVVPGSSILQIISTNEIWVSAWVDETAMAGLTPQQAARVVFRSEPTTSFAGEVARLGRQADPETREFLVDVAVKRLPSNWAVGQRAEVFIATIQKDSALTVPAQTLQWRDGKPGVFVAETGTARWRTVTLGVHGSERVEITDGLVAGDHVVTPHDPRRRLVDGSRILVR
ncbi:MAG: efflux RND transporter periplasmic adaptor subunit [Verrucomicrobiota bacterium]